MNKPELEQSKFQKYCANISIASFWTWLTTILLFVLFIFSFSTYPHSTKLNTWFVIDILLGILAFIVAIISNEIAKVRTPEAQKSFYGSLKLLFVIALAFPVIAFGSSLTNKSDKVFGENTSKIPTTITTNATPQPTPKPKTVNTQPKNPQITCTGPDYKTFQTTEAECVKFRTAWGLSASNTPWPTQTINKPQTTTTTSTYTSTNYPSCTIYFGSHPSTYTTFTPEECGRYQREAQAQNDTMNALWASPTPQSAPQIDTASLISQCKANVDAKYYPIFQRCNSYDAATHQFCYETNTNSKNAEYSACNSIGN